MPYASHMCAAFHGRLRRLHCIANVAYIAPHALYDLAGGMPPPPPPTHTHRGMSATHPRQGEFKYLAAQLVGNARISHARNSHVPLITCLRS